MRNGYPRNPHESHEGESVDVTAIKYRAFLSYSHRDAAWGKWLHGELERYWIDKDLVGRQTATGAVPKTLRPIFRDREDFSAGHSLTEQTLAALEASQFLVVLCSPAAARSKYVNEEIRHFKSMGRADCVIPVIVDGKPDDSERECFPAALRFKIGPDGALTEEREEPIAADARPEGDGKEIAKLKVVAGLLGLGLDEVVHRAERARQRRNRLLASSALVFLFLAGSAIGSGIVAWKYFTKSEDLREVTVENACDLAPKVEVWFNEFGTSIDRLIDLLKDSEQKLETAVQKGGNSPKLRHCKAQTLIHFADGYRTLGDTEQSLNRAKEASSLLERLVESQPRELAWRHDLMRAYRKVGDGLDEQGFSTDALNWYHRSLDIGLGLTAVAAADSKTAEWKHHLSIAYNKIGDVLLFKLRNSTDALGYYRNSLAIRQRLAEADPKNPLWQRDVASAYDRIGDVFRSQGNSTDALNNYRESLRITGRVATDQKRSSDWQRNLALVHDKIGDVERSSGNLTAARDSYEHSLVIRQNLTVKDEVNSRWQRDLAFSHVKVGDVLRDLGKLDEAKKSYRRGDDIVADRAGSDPKNTIWQWDHAFINDRIGGVLFAMAQPGSYGSASKEGSRIDEALKANLTEEALKSYGMSLKIKLRLIDTDPSNLSWWYDLGITHAHMGEVLSFRGDFAGAVKKYRAAQEIFHSLVNADPKNPFWHNDFSMTYERIGDILFDQHKPAEALANYRDFLEIAERLSATDVWWQVEVVRFNWRLATKGDASAQRWATIVTSLQALKAIDRLPAEHSGLLSEAEAELAKLQAY
jgi:tetratricopeptide (TPR) repeat protein